MMAKIPSFVNDVFLSSFVLFYDFKASDLDDGFLSSFIVFFSDFKASDLGDGFHSSFHIYLRF